MISALFFALMVGVEALDSLDMRWTFGAHEPFTMYRRNGKRKAYFARVYLRQENRKRLLIRIRQQDKHLLDHIPVIDKYKDGNGVKSASALGKADL